MAFFRATTVALLLLLLEFTILTTLSAFQSLQGGCSGSSRRCANGPYRTISSTSSTSSSTSLAVAQQQQQQTNKQPGTAKMEVPWEELGFEFRPTNSHVKLVYKDGQGWSEPELVSEPYVQLHIGATALHYGQACFEGLKAFAHEQKGSENGSDASSQVYIFRPDENAKRMQSSCQRIMMAELPNELFMQAVNLAVKDNMEYVPPFGSNGALYIRPLLFGSGPRIGLQPASEYTFLCLAIPVGDYYKGGLSSPVDCLLVTDFDRAAPQGVGGVKVAGNYAADLLPNTITKKKGYPIALYLDAKSQSLIEEFSTSNFVGIDNKNKKFVTPKSPSVLPSITNKSLMQLAADEGFQVEARDVKIEELDDFDEVMAVGTAVVVTPVGSITRLDKDGNEVKKYIFGEPGKIGPTTQRLYQRVRDIQNGVAPDVHGWNVIVE